MKWGFKDPISNHGEFLSPVAYSAGPYATAFALCTGAL